MADVFRTLTDLTKINDANARDLGASDLLNDAPLIKVLYATTASNGTSHKYLKKTGAPTVGFRAIGAGRENSASADTTVTVDLKYLDADFALDVAYCKGYKGGVESAIAKEAQASLRAAMFEFEKQVLNGGTGGFDGLATNLNALSNAKVVNAGGTTAATGSSIYLIRSTPDETGVAAVIGNDGNIAVGDSSLIQLQDGTGKHYAAYLTTIGAWLGMQVGDAHSVVRIANVTEDSGKGATDSLIYSAIARFPASKQPTHIVMNRRSLEQLRKSRTATNATGAPAPRPVDVDGIPIIVTDAILSTEALVS